MKHSQINWWARRSAADLELRAMYHPHLDTFVEMRDQLDRFMDGMDVDHVGLCLDPAHFQAMGDDPVEIVKVYGEAIDYVHRKNWHCKDTTNIWALRSSRQARSI